MDALTRQIVWDRLVSICEEQAQTVIRAAFSPPVRESEDLSAGLFDLEGRMIAQAVTGTPGHINSMAAAVKHFFTRFPVDQMLPGEAYITNDPWLGSGHLNDVTIVTPSFIQGRIVGMFAATVHLIDLGGRGMGPDGKDVFEEGIFIPHMKIMSNGKVENDLLRLIRANSREPTQTEGDIFAILAAGEDGARRLEQLMTEFAMRDLDGIAAHIFSSTQSAIRQAIRKLPDGRYRNSMTIDGYEAPVELVVEMTIEGDQLVIDFAGTSARSDFGINVPLIYTAAYSFYGIKCVLLPEAPSNDALLSAFSIRAPEGSIVNPLKPAPVSARHIIGHSLPDVVLGCLAQAAPGKTLAESGMMWNPYIRGTDTNGSGQWEFFSLMAGGMGARPTCDGLDATAFPAVLKGISVEAIEAISPIIVWRKEFRSDSGGPGKYRGGLGQSVEIGLSEQRPFSFRAMFDRTSYPARGREGGENGALGIVSLGSGKRLAGKGNHTVPVGDVLRLELPGGGGYGDPSERSAEAVSMDLREGKITPEAAANKYRAGLQ